MLAPTERRLNVLELALEQEIKARKGLEQELITAKKQAHERSKILFGHLVALALSVLLMSFGDPTLRSLSWAIAVTSLGGAVAMFLFD